MTWPENGYAHSSMTLEEGYTDLDVAEMAKEMIMALAGFVNRNGKTVTEGTFTIRAHQDPFFDPVPHLKVEWEPNE
jgi:hypothetical protein